MRGEAGRDLLKATEAGIGVVDVTLVSLSGFLHARAGCIPPVILAQRMLGWKDQEFKPSLKYLRPPKKNLKIKWFFFFFEEKEGEKNWLEH